MEPQTQRNSAQNPFHETMREVVPGDLILVCNARIVAIGIAPGELFCAPQS